MDDESYVMILKDIRKKLMILTDLDRRMKKMEGRCRAYVCDVTNGPLVFKILGLILNHALAFVVVVLALTFCANHGFDVFDKFVGMGR